MNSNKINTEEITTKCNEIVTLAENYRDIGDRLFEISTCCTPEVLSVGNEKIQEKIDEVALLLKSTYLQVLLTANQVKTEAIKANRIETGTKVE